MGAAAELEPLHRYSLSAYHRLIEAGAFEDAHVELLDGLLADMSPKSREHENAVEHLVDWLSAGLDRARYQLRVASPLTLAGSEPEPDVAVIARSTARPYHPASAALVIEVSVSSLRRDLGVKAGLYAAAGIGEYWVADLAGQRVICHSGPADGRYTHTRVATAGDLLVAADLTAEPLDVAALLVAAT